MAVKQPLDQTSSNFMVMKQPFDQANMNFMIAKQSFDQVVKPFFKLKCFSRKRCSDFFCIP